MQKQNKRGLIQAHHVTFERSDGVILKFDSKFEWEVYKSLYSTFGAEKIELQAPVRIKPEGQRFKQRDWRIDFRVNLPHESTLIEAKNPQLVDEALKLKLEWAECMGLHLDTFCLVLPDSAFRYRPNVAKFLRLPLSQIITLNQLNDRLEMGVILP